MDDFKGKTVLVTGGNKGVGKGVALEFARRGANLAIGYNQNPEMARRTLAELNGLTRAIAVQADLSMPEGCEKLANETIDNFGGVDILINNAAMQTQYSLLESSYDILKSILDVNLRAAFLMMKHTHAYLKRSGEGRIILISSVHGKRATDFDCAYAVSKGALEMLMREAAVEFAADRITVNAIAPAAVDIEGKTGAPRAFTLKDTGARRMSLYPLGRRGLPSDVAYLACFLASKEACHITGATYRIDGGAMLL